MLPQHQKGSFWINKKKYKNVKILPETIAIWINQGYQQESRFTIYSELSDYTSAICFRKAVGGAGVVELADTPDLGSGDASHGGSSPSARTIYV